MDFILRELNGYLSSRNPANDDHAVLASPAATEAASPADIANKVMVSLINIERESFATHPAVQFRPEAGKPGRVAQPLNFNLILLVCANYETSYPDSLKMLSLVLEFFQDRPLFTHETDPELPTAIQRLAVEWRDVELQSLHNLWSVLGGRYLPSAVYKARMLIDEEARIGGDLPGIAGTGVDT